jgi:hypothetical protein
MGMTAPLHRRRLYRLPWTNGLHERGLLNHLCGLLEAGGDLVGARQYRASGSSATAQPSDLTTSVILICKEDDSI